MSPEEQNLLQALFDRIQTASNTLRDHDAEIFIEQATRAQPNAPYYLAQAVIVQEKGLEAASLRIRELEERIHHLETGSGEHRQADQRGGFLSSIFGNGPTQQAATPNSDLMGNPPRTPYPPEETRNTQRKPSGPWDSAPSTASTGGSFLRGAAGTAAGVAGGMLLANSLSGIFASHLNSLGWGSALSESGDTGQNNPDISQDSGLPQTDDADTGDDFSDSDASDFGGSDGGDFL